MANFAQIITPENFARNLFQQNVLNPLSLSCFLTSSVKNKLGPDNIPSNGQTWPSTAYIEYIYIYILLECEGARKRSKTWLRGSPRRAVREPEANRGGQNATKIGVWRRLKKCRKSVVSPFWWAAHDPKREKMASFDSLRAPLQLFVLRVFGGFGGPVAERKLRKRFVSAGFASGGVFGQTCFLSKKTGLRKCAKRVSGPKKGAQLVFLSHISDHFWRTVSGGGFSCGAERVFGPL